MQIGRAVDMHGLNVGGLPVERVDDFCHLVNAVTDTSSCDKDIKTH